MKPKILLYDIETTPNVSYTWATYEQNVIAFKKEWELASFAYKWLGEKEINCFSQRDLSEKQVLKKLWNLLDEADAVITHNGDSFDNKKVYAKFVTAGLPPPAPFQSIDTKKIAKSNFKFNTNKLDDLGNVLGVGRKQKHSGFDMWLGCMANKRSSWNEMIKYNKQDVALLERVYMKLRPYTKNHPNLSLLDGKRNCPVCNGSAIIKKGLSATHRTLKQRYKCTSKGCGAWFTGPYKGNKNIKEYV